MLKMISPLRSKFHHTYFIWQSPGRRCGTAWSKPGVTGDESKNRLQTQDGHTWEPPPSTFLKPLRLPGPDPAKGREQGTYHRVPKEPTGIPAGGLHVAAQAGGAGLRLDAQAGPRETRAPGNVLDKPLLDPRTQRQHLATTWLSFF